jgi:hypothetical protein
MQDEIEVTQADREALYDIDIEMSWVLDEDERKAILNIVSRVRLAAEQRGAERMKEAAAKALEEDSKLCDCFARSEGECACGAWSDYKTVPVARTVDIVRALDARKIGTGHE